MKLTFSKMHGLGNDFIVIDDRSSRLRNIPDLSRRLCDRRFGIGADQLLLLCRSRKADFRMRIFNADGSEVEMCGNGIRCLAKYIWENIARHGRAPARALSVETAAGIMRPVKSGDLVTVDMGEPLFDPDRIPLDRKRLGPHARRYDIVKLPLRISGRTFRIACLSMGNPHAVIIVRNVEKAPVVHYGPLIENHKLFPGRTNVEFVQIKSRRSITMRVWERGAGETMACGTGASAAAVASFMLGHTERRVSVQLPGGRLLINWDRKNNRVFMTGPAEHVFDGTMDV